MDYWTTKPPVRIGFYFALYRDRATIVEAVRIKGKIRFYTLGDEIPYKPTEMRARKYMEITNPSRTEIKEQLFN